MGWFEVLNIALNAKQSYDLHQARQRLQDIEGKAVYDELEKQALLLLKNLVFSTANDISALEPHIEETPQPVYVTLQLLRRRLAEFNVSPHIFPDFSDKEYVQDVQQRLNDMLEKTKARLTPDEINRANETVQAITQMPNLEEAIKVIEANENLEATQTAARQRLQELEDEWRAQQSKKQKWSLVGMGAFLWIPVALMLTCVLPAFKTDSTLWNMLVNIGIIALLLSMVGAFVVGVIFFAKQPSDKYGALKKERATLRATLYKKPQDTSSIGMEFQGKTGPELRNIRQTRKQLIEETMGEVSGYEKLLNPPE